MLKMNGANRSAEAMGCKNALVGERSTLRGNTCMNRNRQSGSKNVGLINTKNCENPNASKTQGFLRKVHPRKVSRKINNYEE
ncbi:hypothetical protein CXB51_015273 [Gossypium anomalum]|uniref:Uncharacterized protein n=1 Tax=Gossypium anomalum TaxID=47600 RepID=A0A8J5ZB70_9ROSI|nr:hypothetical protein CXB51_015273 [Gossypium anomalum]